jgi:cytochrome P450
MFIPFSVGKRNCIGQNLAMLELRVLIANMIKYYDFEAACDLNSIKYELFVTFKPSDLKLNVKKRQI